jgi:hypothetical protein
MGDAQYTPATVLYEEEEVEFAPSAYARKNRNKQGHSCCGFCCDTRRAVIIVNILMMVVSFLTIALAYGAYELAEAVLQNDGDKALANEKKLKQIPWAFLMLVALVKMGFFASGVFGAIRYNKYMVSAALCVYAMSFTRDILHFSLSGVLLAGCCAYPHIFFLKEMKNNVMTPENYPNEVQSCCCV